MKNMKCAGRLSPQKIKEKKRKNVCGLLLLYFILIEIISEPMKMQENVIYVVAAQCEKSIILVYNW